MDRDKIIHRIRTMKMYADDAAASPEEAASFAAKAAKLVADYLITEDELKHEKSDVTTTQYQIKSMNEWRRVILIGCCSMMGAQLATGRHRQFISIIARPLVADSAYELFRRLEKDIIKQCRLMYHGQQASARRAEPGMAVGVLMKMREIRNKNADLLLPVVIESAEVNKWIEESGRFKTDKREAADLEEMVNSTHEGVIGYLSADRVEIHKGVK